MAHATVSRCLKRRGLSRMPAAEREEVRRFEWPCPGDLLQMDTKRLARFSRPGHKVTGDRSRTSQQTRTGRLGVLPLDHRRPHPPGLHRDPPRREGRRPSPRSSTRALDVLRRPTASTPSGCRPTTPGRYIHNRWPARAARRARDPAPTASRPRTPKRNGKVERYQQTLAREWAYGPALPQLNSPPPPALPHLAQPLQLRPQPQLTGVGWRVLRAGGQRAVVCRRFPRRLGGGWGRAALALSSRQRRP